MRPGGEQAGVVHYGVAETAGQDRVRLVSSPLVTASQKVRNRGSARARAERVEVESMWAVASAPAILGQGRAALLKKVLPSPQPPFHYHLSHPAGYQGLTRVLHFL